MTRSLPLLAALALMVAMPALAQTVTTSVTRTTSYQYDAFGTLIQQVVEPDDPAYRVETTYVPEPSYGALTRSTVTWRDPLTGQMQARTESMGYDTRFRFVESQTNAKNHTETSTHDAGTGNVLTATDANQLTTRWDYDTWGRKIRETRPDGTATAWAYRRCVDTCLNGAVNVHVTQSFAGTSQTSVPVEEFADTLGRTVLTRTWGFDGTAVLNEKVYDSLGRVERIARPRFSSAAAVWTRYERDAIGRVVRIRAPDQTGTGEDVTAYAYDGLRLTATNARGQVRIEERNPLGKVKRVTDAAGYPTGYLYDPFGNLAYTLDALANEIVIEYDRLGRKTALKDPDLGRWTYVVDPLGQVRRQTDARGQVTTLDYDELGRVVRRLEPDLDSRWDYDTAAYGVGELAEAYTVVNGEKDYRRVQGYDAQGRPNRSVISQDWDYIHTTQYDSFGRVAVTQQGRAARGAGTAVVAHAFQTRYNARGYASQIERGDGTLLWQAQEMDAQGRSTREQLGNGVSVRHGYNTYTGRLHSIRAGPGAESVTLQDDTYGYDPLGNLLSRNQLTATAGVLLSESFTYDNLNRLESSTLGSVERRHAYSVTGSILSKTGVGIYSYPAAGAQSVHPNAVSSISGTVAGVVNPQFTYDANGNLLTGLGRKYEWTAANQPAWIERLSGDSAVQRTEFVYGPDHERVRQSIRSVSSGVLGTATTVIRYAGAMEKEIDTAAGTTTLRMQMPLGLGYLEEKIAGTAVGPAATAAANARYFLKDHLGSTLAVLDAAQAVLQRMSYDAWGRRRNADGSDDTGPQWGSLKNGQDHSGYTGHEHLDQLGLVHMNARLYDPLLGRHTSADPTVPDPGNGQSFNRYSYVLNNALAFVDPTGLHGEEADRNNGEKARYRERVRDECAFSASRACVTGAAWAGLPSEKTGGNGLQIFGPAQVTSVEGAITGEPNSAGPSTMEVLAGGLKSAGMAMLPSGEEISVLTGVGALALAEPTPFGEIGFGVVTAGVALRGLVRGTREFAAVMRGGANVAKGCCCFPEGTPVLAEEGLVPIEQVRVGQWVYARDPDTGETALKPVTQLIHTEGKLLYELSLQGIDGQVSRTQVTDNHPYWVIGHGWVDSADLRAGMLVGAFDTDQPLTVLGIVPLGRTQLTYNFTVADFHTYFVGEQRAFVHNSDCACGLGLKVGQGKVFTSADPLVGDLATKIDAAYPGHVVGVNVPIRNAAGQLVTDADILLKNGVVQVKSGGGKGLTSQLQRTEQATGLPTIGYGPGLKPSILSGCAATNCERTLIEVVKP